MKDEHILLIYAFFRVDNCHDYFSNLFSKDNKKTAHSVIVAGISNLSKYFI